MPMQKAFTKQTAPRGRELKDGPKRSSIDLILAFSKSLEVKKTSQSNQLFIHLN
jgi:hypothetical protein